MLKDSVEIKIELNNKRGANALQGYYFYHIDGNLDVNENQQIIQKIKESNLVIINILDEDKKDIFIGFKKTILHVENSLEKILQLFIDKNHELKFYFLQNNKQINYNDNIAEDKIFQLTTKLDEEIDNFNKNFDISYQSKIFRLGHTYKMNESIKSCISGYLIGESYIKLIKEQKINFSTAFNEANQKENKESNIKEWTEDEYIELRLLGIGSSLFKVELIYQIETGHLFAIKKTNEFSKENKKLNTREYDNYLTINYPFIPKFYGKQKKDNCLIIQYIHGQSLDNIDITTLTEDDKITIIIELMLIIKYLHDKNFIYRDLKPSNIVIDENKSTFLIDLDRMIKINSPKSELQNFTVDFSSEFVAPEVNLGEITYKNDIYSLGKMIQYLQFENYKRIDFLQQKCTNNEANKRPSIFELISEFYSISSKDLDQTLVINIPEFQFIQGVVYYEGEYIEQDINKSIYYLSLAAHQNQRNAQIRLGLIYYENKYIKPDINKSIYYFSLAADQNDPTAQFMLGIIYSEGKYIKQDINKAIYYFSHAANQNDLNGQIMLGIIYSEGKFIKQDINKAIHYFQLAASQNHPDAQYKLGVIYYEGKYIQRDINKSIHYLSLAANQNYPVAQYNLGIIYSEGKYIEPDINKSLYFLSLASNLKYPDAQFKLGVVYYEGKCIERNINKSIHYLSLAANQNHPIAQNMLGLIYYDGKYVKHDINKSIHYLSLAANQNLPDAQYLLGLIYYNGKYIKHDINKSIYYLSLAANQNHPDAQFKIGIIYYEGKIIKRDINKAIYYLSHAANQNQLNAQFKLSFIYYEGKYIERDVNKSIYYLLPAANQNHPKALFNLGIIFYEGKYIKRDINKSIHYFSLAANQNEPNAQFELGIINYEGKYIERNINKSIYYFTLAANQNDHNAQFLLGLIYYEDKYIKRDINKSIYYFSLAANYNHPKAQNMLGFIYYEGKYIERDINKSIHYFSLSASQNDPNAQYNLGIIYCEGKYIERDINKSIRYLSLSANQNSNAQFLLGTFHSIGFIIKKNMIKAIDYFIQSSSNGNINGHFAVGYFYHEGKYVEKDIKKSIQHYKEASTFNNHFAKNNLGIIYRYGFGDEISQNCGLSMDYFEEAIQRFKDKVSMYNLSHIYIYEDKNKSRLKKSIELLIESIKQNFTPSIDLLCIALIKLFGFNIEIILEELNKLTENSSVIPKLIYEMIIHKKLLNKQIYESYYQLFSTINYLYDFKGSIISTTIFNEKEKVLTKKIIGKNITQEFYNGFGSDIKLIE